MNSRIIQSLRRERNYLKHSLEAVEEMLRIQEEGLPMSPEEWSLLAHTGYTYRAAFGFPYLAPNSEKVVFVMRLLSRFARKEEIMLKVMEFQPEQNHEQLASILSRMVSDSRLVSLKYNRSNLFVFYGLPSFVDFEAIDIKEGFAPEPHELAEIRVRKMTLNCGGVLKR